MSTQYNSTSPPPEHQDDPVLGEDRGLRQLVHSVSGVLSATLPDVFPWGGVFCGQKVSGISAGQCLMRFSATRIGLALGLSTGRTSTPQSNAVTTQ